MNKELSPNANLLHYKIISAIGKGGMDEVFLAQETKLDQKVALKILPSAGVSRPAFCVLQKLGALLLISGHNNHY